VAIGSPELHTILEPPTFSYCAKLVNNCKSAI